MDKMLDAKYCPRDSERLTLHQRGSFGCHRCGNNAAISLALWVGKRVRRSLRYACGSCPLSCAQPHQTHYRGSALPRLQRTCAC